MSETSIIMIAIEENPTTTIKVFGVTALTFKWIIFDPSRHCTAFMTILSATATYLLIGVSWTVCWASWQADIEWIFKLMFSAAGLGGGLITTYSVWKKLRTNRRKRRITRTRNGKN